MAKISHKSKKPTPHKKTKTARNNEGDANQFGIANVLSLLGLVGYVVFFLFGGIYVFNIYLASFVSLVLLVILFLLSKEFVRQKTKQREQTDFRQEMVLGAGYLVVFALSFLYTFHFIDVEFTRKSQLKIAGKRKIEKLSALEKAYFEEVQKKVDSIGTQVNTDSLAFFNRSRAQRAEPKVKLKELLGLDDDAFVGNDGPIAERIGKERRKIIDQMKANYNLVKPVFDKTKRDYGQSKRVFDGWQRFKIRYEYTAHLDTLYATMYQVAKKQMPDFNHPAKIDLPDIAISQPMRSFGQASIGKKLGILVGMLLIHLLILLPYFRAERPEPTQKGKIIRPEDRKGGGGLGIKINKN